MAAAVCGAQWAGYVLHPLIKSYRPYFPNLFDYKASKYYFKYKNSKKSGKSGKYRVRVKNPDPDSGKFFTSNFSKIRF